MLILYTALDAQAHGQFRRTPITAAPSAYQTVLTRKTHVDAYVQTVAGIWLLRQALAHAGYAADAMQTVAFSRHNRPELSDGPAFSISHSDDYVACALVDAAGHATQVGLDIEQPRNIAPARMARLAGNDEERAVVASHPQRFFDFWCAREATVKATGRVGLKRIRETHLDRCHAWLDGQCWHLYPVSLTRGLTGCMVCDTADEPLTIQPLTVLPAK